MPADNELHKAANKGSLEDCRRIIETPPPEDQDPDERFDVNSPGAGGRRPLHRAAGVGALDVCEYFVSIGAEVDGVDSSGRTALHWATIAGFEAVVQFLLSNNANVFAETSSKMSPLHMACEAGKEKVIAVLLESFTEVKFGADVAGKKLELFNLKNGDAKTACEIAVASKNAATVQALKDGGDPNAASAACVIS